jgi:hypothetical protein
MVGLERLQGFCHDDGRFSLWCGGTADLDTTARVAHRLLAFRDTPFDSAKEMLERSAGALRKARVKDNQLLPLGAEFRAGVKNASDAAALYFHGGSDKASAEALGFLRKTAQGQNGTRHWPAGSAWGGSLETTCDALRVLYTVADPLFKKGFAYVAGQLIDGRLYSTADTRALVELLTVLKADGRVVNIDGVEQQLVAPVTGHRVVALDNAVFVRVDTETEIDYLEPRANFLFDLSLGRTRLSLGERTRLVVSLRESARCPLARIYLPPNLALLKGGANAQEAHLPVINSEVAIDVVAVRKGRASLHVTVHDLYDAEKVGTAPGLVVVVE